MGRGERNACAMSKVDEKVSKADSVATFTSRPPLPPIDREKAHQLNCLSSVVPSMPSLFSRSRTNTGFKKNQNIQQRPAGYDEFGRVGLSRPKSNTVGSSAQGVKDKDRKRGQEKDKRLRTLSTPKGDRHDFDQDDGLYQIPDGSFLPLNLERPWTDPETQEPLKQTDYGYLSFERHVILGLEQVARLVDVVADEIGTRGLTTPFIFSTLAMDISAPAIKRLIAAFLQTCANPSSEDAERRWREEARFSGPHELGSCLRWGLARVVRIVGGQEVRGLISWEHYLDFRDSEAGELFRRHLG